VPANEIWTFGFIQACPHYNEFHFYGDDGVAKWQVPELKNGIILISKQTHVISHYCNSFT